MACGWSNSLERWLRLSGCLSPLPCQAGTRLRRGSFCSIPGRFVLLNPRRQCPWDQWLLFHGKHGFTIYGRRTSKMILDHRMKSMGFSFTFKTNTCSELIISNNRRLGVVVTMCHADVCGRPNSSIPFQQELCLSVADVIASKIFGIFESLVFDVNLIGGLEHEFYVSIYWECHHPNWRTPSFFRWAQTTTQEYVW